MLKKYYLGGFFGRPYRTNGIKTRLGLPLTGKARGNSSAINGNDGVSVPPLYIFL